MLSIHGSSSVSYPLRQVIAVFSHSQVGAPRSFLLGICDNGDDRSMESNLDNRTSPQPLPSLPPSPTTSEDLGRAHAWTEQEDSDDGIPKKNDKGKAREVTSLNDEGETSEEEGGGSYPPTNEDAAETRRIEDVSLGERTVSLNKSILTAYNYRIFGNGKWQNDSDGKLRAKVRRHPDP